MSIPDYLHVLSIDLGSALLSIITISYAIGAIGLNLHFGYTGLINIGQAGFMLLGAYGFAITIKYSHNLWFGIFMALAAAAVFAVLLGIPTLRLRGDYLAIVTIAAAEIIRLLGNNQNLADYTGGTFGIPNNVYAGPFVDLSPFPKTGTYSVGPYDYSWSAGDSWWLRIVSWGLVVLLAIFTFFLTRSPWGRVVRAIREDEDAVRSLGKNVTLYKMQSLIIGGLIGALAGVVNVLATSVSADGMGRTLTFELYTCLLLGGAATVFGPILGTFLYWLFVVFLRDTVSYWVPDDVMSQQQVPQFTWIVVGITLMLLVIFRPQGILGNKKELTFGA
jgi:branched-chain amino acid transport system permease protein